MLALMMPDQYGVLLNEATTPQTKGPAVLDCWWLAKLEREKLQADHTEVGAWLLRHWKLPDYLCRAAAGSLDPTRAIGAGAYQPLIRCVALAVQIADIWIRPDSWQTSPQIAEQVQQWFGLDEDDYLAVLEAIGEKFPDIANLFQIRSLDAGCRHRRSGARSTGVPQRSVPIRPCPCPCCPIAPNNAGATR